MSGLNLPMLFKLLGLPLKNCLLASFLLLLLPVHFLVVVPAADAAMLSCLPLVSVMQEKVRVFSGKGSTREPAAADDLLNPVAEGFLTTENLDRTSEPQVVKVGCLLPLSGLYGEYGQRFLRGMELALGIYPGAESCRDRTIKLLVRDTRSMPDMAVSLIHELVEKEQASLLVGPVVGPVAISAAREAARLQVPIITLTSQPGVAGTGPLVFQHFITARNQAEELVRLMVEILGMDRKVVVLYPDTLFGQTFCRCLATAANQAGLKAVETVEYRASATDFGPVVKKIISIQSVATGKNPARTSRHQNRWASKDMVLVLPGSRRRLNLLLPQLFHYGLENILVFGSRGWHDLLGDGKLSHGVKKVFFVDAFSASGKKMPAVLLQYRKKYEQQFKKKASLYDAYGYDTAILIKRVVAQLEGNQPASAMQLGEIIRTLPEMEMVTGTTKLRADGEIEKRLYRFTVEKGGVDFLPQTPPLPGQ
ncbi:MAG: hypothetical protein DRH04_03205 [Deltaproteobacteria bacterium]|nr:MAG: hypothetical protein DRH04_03205 [Deltaproteobacteria bacterium]